MPISFTFVLKLPRHLASDNERNPAHLGRPVRQPNLFQVLGGYLR
ncbi:hypothetical protein LINPERHAP1_LOCUS28571 [Linum perenne]